MFPDGKGVWFLPLATIDVITNKAFLDFFDALKKLFGFNVNNLVSYRLKLNQGAMLCARKSWISIVDTVCWLLVRAETRINVYQTKLNATAHS